MEAKKIFEEVMATQQELALATSVADQPNVRIVNFLYDPMRKKVFFSTFGDNDKTVEIAKNAKVACTTVAADGGDSHVRILEGRASVSDCSFAELGAAWIAKMPFYEELIQNAGPQLRIFEIAFEKATVISGMTFREEITVSPG